MAEPSRLLQLVHGFRGRKVLVVGDLMLDRYVWGRATRISPEAPVPVVLAEQETLAPGGAANTAANIAALGGKAVLVGFLGKDEAAQELQAELRRRGVECEAIPWGLPTIQKVRVMGGSQQLIRVDYEKPGTGDAEKLLEACRRHADDADLIVVSDYAKGAISERLMAGLRDTRKRIIVDPKPQNGLLYRGVFLVKPNAIEAGQMSGADCATEEGVAAAGRLLAERFGSHVLITRGRQGISLYERTGDVTHIPTAATEVSDVTGAGDTATAAVALTLAAGGTLKEACVLANAAGGIKVGKTGTATVSQQELAGGIERRGTKVRNVGELAVIVKDLQRRGKKVVFTNGCYDILHIGHTRLLQHARSLGDALVLGLNTDASVRRLKGPTRPIIPQEERAEIMGALPFVDHIVFFDEDTPVNIIGALQPDVHVKGGDWRIEDLPERSVIEGYGGKIVIVPHVGGKSTTGIVNRIKSQGPEASRGPVQP